MAAAYLMLGDVSGQLEFTTVNMVGKINDLQCLSAAWSQQVYYCCNTVRVSVYDDVQAPLNIISSFYLFTSLYSSFTIIADLERSKF